MFMIQKKLRLKELGLTSLLFLGGAISIEAADLDVTLETEVLGAATPQAIVLKQKQQYTKKNGRIRYKWVRVERQKVNDTGSMQFQFPENIGTENAQGAYFLNAFKLIGNIKNPKRQVSSSIFSNNKTDIIFVLDATPNNPAPPQIDSTFIKKVSQATLHKLNRITFGVTPKLLDRVNTIGINT
jgi:hypothetical protein